VGITTETSLLQPAKALSAIEEAYCGKVMAVAVAQDPSLQFAQTVEIVEGARVGGFVEGATVLGFAEGPAVSAVEGAAEIGFPEGIVLASVRVGTAVGSDPGEDRGKPEG
jgi:hypothetical protein